MTPAAMRADEEHDGDSRSRDAADACRLPPGFFSSAGSRSGAPLMHLQDRNTEALRLPSRRAAHPAASALASRSGRQPAARAIQKPSAVAGRADEPGRAGLPLQESRQTECRIVQACWRRSFAAVGNLDEKVAASVDSQTEAITNIPRRGGQPALLTAASRYMNNYLVIGTRATCAAPRNAAVSFRTFTPLCKSRSHHQRTGPVRSRD